MNVRGKKVLLRAIEEKDLPILHKWANDPEIWYILAGWHFPTSEKDQRAWFESLSASSKEQRFAVETENLGLIGTANLVNINWKDRNAYHGMMLGNKDTRGKGYGMDTIMTVMRYAFEELGFQRLDGSMIEYNQASLAVYINKCGWKKEGRQHNWYFRKNRFWDKIIVGVNRDEYFGFIEKINYWE